MSEMLLKVQIGPVQEFICQARSTRDMWAGSYMLSWLAAAAMKVFKEAGCEFVFPNLDDQPLYNMFNEHSSKEGLIPSLPNVFMVIVPGDDLERLVAESKDALKNELSVISSCCWQKMQKIGADKTWRSRWDDQVKRFPVFNWHAVDYSKNEWQNAVKQLGQEMAARRNTRDFSQWGVILSSEGKVLPDKTLVSASKDVLSGKEEIICDDVFWQENDEFWKGAGPYGAMNCIKRLFPLEYLEQRFSSRRDYWNDMSMINTRDLAACNTEGVKDQGVDSNGEPIPVNGYIAVLAMDGDSMGAELQKLTSKEEYSNFSKILAGFAEHEALRIVEENDGQLVYAGGDDVLALLPSNYALKCAQELREAFKKTMAAYELDSSCGIAVAHYMFPLQRTVQEARHAEKRAKQDRGRAAFAVSLLKRSGEIIHWGGKWDSDAYALYELYTKMAAPEEASSRFPYALAQLLQPYELSKGTLADFKNVVFKEFQHIRSRQLLCEEEDTNKEFDLFAKRYLDHLFGHGNPADFTNLFLASAFINRQRGES